jgi:hypothetical protein
VGVDELHEDDAEDVSVGDVAGHEDFREAAQKFSQAAGSAARRMVGESFEEEDARVNRVAAEMQMK